MNDKSYYIGDIATELGLSQRAVRYYEELGFIKPLRTDGGFRTYSKQDLELLRFVVEFKDLGMTLDEIRSLIIQDRTGLTGDAVRHIRETLTSKKTELENKLKKYEEGISQINKVLNILLDCKNCGNLSIHGECEECIKKRGCESAPLISPLLFRDTEANKKE